jgi:hypothetical protein
MFKPSGYSERSDVMLILGNDYQRISSGIARDSTAPAAVGGHLL